MDLPRVIIFGNNTLNTLGLLRSLGEKGIKPILLLEPCNLAFCCLRFSKYIGKIHYLTSVEDGLRVLREEYWTEKEKQIIINAGDTSICLLDAHYDELKDRFYVFNARAEQGRINYYMNKLNQFYAAGICGLKLIKTWTVQGGSNLPEDITYPCLIKGANSAKYGKKGMCVCNSKEELKLHLDESCDFLVQEYIKRDYELNINGISFDHGETQCIPAVIYKVRDSFARQGEFLRVDDVEDYPDDIIFGIKKLIKDIGYEGLFSVELLKRGDDYFFLEINLRSDGLGYAYTAAGINYPYMWIQYVLGDLDVNELKINAHTPLFAMIEHDVRNILERNISVLQWVKDLFRANAFFVFNKRDVKPYLYLVHITFRQAFKKGMRKLFVRK